MNPRSAAGLSPLQAPGAGRDDLPRPNWWIRLASSGWDKAQSTPQDREFVRRSRLTAWIIFGLLIATLVLLPGGIAVTSTLVAIVAVDVGLVMAIVLNRSGYVTLAGLVLTLLISAAVLYAVASTGALSLVYLPAYDLLVISVVVAASVLSGRAAYWIAGVNVALIVADFTLQGHAADLDAAVRTFGTASLIARPIALQIIVATVAYLWMRGTHDAIQRADRAEEMAALEHAVAEQRRQLEFGIQQILETHVRVANGDYTARAPLNQDNILWQIAASLNNLLQRLQKSGQAEHQLRRTDEELRRLAAAIDDAQAGRRPIWPAPTGTSADLIIERITGRNRQPAPQGMLAANQPAGFPQQTGMLAPASRMPSVPQLPQMPPMAHMPQPQPMPPMTGPMAVPVPGFGQPAPAPGFGQPARVSNPIRMPAPGSGPLPADPEQPTPAPENPWFAPPEPPSW